MKLGELLRGVPTLQVGRDLDPTVKSLAYDSRRVKPGTLFFAIRGEKADGHSFIPQALKQGAVAIVSELESPTELAGRWVRVRSEERRVGKECRSRWSPYH